MEVKWNNLAIPRNKKATLSWDAKYAGFVHEGYTRNDGSIAPARPWVNTAIDNFDFIGELKQELAKTSSIRNAFEDMANSFGQECQNNIEAVIWNWDRNTIRSNGQEVSSPRDIIDTEELYDSYSIQHSE